MRERRHAVPPSARREWLPSPVSDRGPVWVWKQVLLLPPARARRRGCVRPPPSTPSPRTIAPPPLDSAGGLTGVAPLVVVKLLLFPLYLPPNFPCRRDPKSCELLPILPCPAPLSEEA